MKFALTWLLKIPLILSGIFNVGWLREGLNEPHFSLDQS